MNNKIEIRIMQNADLLKDFQRCIGEKKMSG